jgi:thiol-disulfide isomerase/thioredoxin
VEDLSQLKLREIQAELKERGVAYADCFDRDSLTRRLLDARAGKVKGTMGDAVKDTPTASQPSPQQSAATSQSTTSFDRDKTLAELRGMRVSELRTECAKRKIRWANMIDKEDLVQALLKAREASASFSASGALTPGKVGELTDKDLEKELSTPSKTPLLLDIYAVWCGPCQLMKPQLEAAAEELGDTVRMAKIDSDKFPQWSSRLKVGAFPTVIVFGPNGKEVRRVEGALMKDDLIRLSQSHI